jgi:hypothetical protein
MMKTASETVLFLGHRTILLQMAQGWLALAQKDETNADRRDGLEGEIN